MVVVESPEDHASNHWSDDTPDEQGVDGVAQHIVTGRRSDRKSPKVRGCDPTGDASDANDASMVVVKSPEDHASDHWSDDTPESSEEHASGNWSDDTP
jgi:hypothetical protein